MIQRISTSYGKTKVYRNGSGQKIIIVPGYGASITHNRELVDRLSGKGYDAFAFDQPRRGTRIDPFARQEQIVQEILRATVPADEKVYAVTHSLGAVSALRAAAKDPERFMGLLLMQPSGIGDKQTFLELLQRIGKKTAKNHTDALKQNGSVNSSGAYTVSFRQVLRFHAATTIHIARNPFLAFKEAKAAIEYDITDDVLAVEKLGIPVNIVIVHDDELFSIKNLLGYDRIMELPGTYSSLVHKEAKHDTFWMHPEQTADLIDGFVKNL